VEAIQFWIESSVPASNATLEKYTPIGSVGADMGFTYIWEYALLSLEGGLGYVWLNEEDGIIVPNLLAKADIVPFKKGFALRLGYLAEFASTGWSDNYKAAFSSSRAFKAGSLGIMGRVMAGFAIWF
jgi:hypothetical protein